MDSIDPLASLKMFSDVTQKEIEEIEKREASIKDPAQKKLLMSMKSEKQSVLRSLTNATKTHLVLEREKEMISMAFQEESNLMSKILSSSIIAKPSHRSLNDASVASIKAKNTDMKAFDSSVSTIEGNMKKINEMCTAETQKLDTKIAELQAKLNGYEGILASAKKNLAVLKPDEAAAMTKNLDTMGTLNKDIVGLTARKAEFETKKNSTIIKTVDQFLKKHDQVVIDLAVKRIQEEDHASKKVDLCFLIDGTSSMGKWINLTRSKVLEIISEVRKVYSDCEFRIAIVVYRDFDMGSNSFNVQQFVTEPRTIETFLDGVKATGGGDPPEDINGGFQRLLKDLEWQSMSKVLIHFADAPCHGPEFNDLDDSHPNPPSDIKWETIFREVKSLGIDYNFMKITNYTNQMTEKFKSLWEECGLYCIGNKMKNIEFKIYPISTDANEFVKTIKTSILDSISRSISYMRTGSSINPYAVMDRRVDEVIKEKKISTHFETPNWSVPSSMWSHKTGSITSLSMQPIEKILSKGFKTFLGQCELMIQKEHFACGTFNYAHAAKLTKTENKIVAKRPEKVTPDLENLLKLDLKKRGLAIILAQDFNKELKKAKNFKWARLFFVHTFLFKAGNELWLLEGYIDGDFVKYTNNLDAINKTQEIRHFTAFAHYTYQRTNGEYLVTDFQGVGSFLLTDPTLHSKSREFIKSGDFGVDGFIRFFSKHECNDICKALGLKRPSLPQVGKEKWEEKPYDHPSTLNKKCMAKFCNKELEEEERRFCSFCSELIDETKSKKCVQCHITFRYSPNSYLLTALNEPKKCPDCKKRKRRQLGHLFGDDSD